ncbi:MAG: lipopolysaccharide biosynthesis protein [Bacteroidales bacterium]|nr:lipopolysaccharide biosynthesis protein [Bacteroidales bacterium]MDD4670667.1 lipopolysaccharide biosynthesis protein [Bacteroidales bacterium]
MNIKSFAKDTAIYGLSSIVGRFLNYLLVPLHTWKIVAERGGYGIVSNLYAYTALFLALLTFGMETTLFRFASKSDVDEKMVYSNALRMVVAVSALFVVVVLSFLTPISNFMGYSDHPEYVVCFVLITALDAVQAIMFSRLRQQHRPARFVMLKFAYIIPSILLNCFIFLAMDKIQCLNGIFVRFNYGVGLIFFANLLCSFFVTILFIPEFKGILYGFNKELAKKMLRYSLPLLVLGLLGILNQVADKIMFPYLMPENTAMTQLGIYGACSKIAMIMALLTQAFRYAYEPIVFEDCGSNNISKTLSAGMKYFIAFSLLAFLSVIMYMPILKYLVGKSYWEGLGVIPLIMIAEIFMGIYFNLSFWYKITDQTWWGAIVSFIGAAVMIGTNVVLVPKMGYWGCAWGGVAGYGTCMLLNFVLSSKKYPIQYDIGSILICIFTAIAIYCASLLPKVLDLNLSVWIILLYNTVLICAYILVVGYKFEIHKAISIYRGNRVADISL